MWCVESIKIEDDYKSCCSGYISLRLFCVYICHHKYKYEIKISY